MPFNLGGITLTGVCLLSCSRFCFLRLAMLAPPAAAYIAPQIAGFFSAGPSQEQLRD